MKKLILSSIAITTFVSVNTHANLDREIQQYTNSSAVKQTVRTLRRNVLGRSKGLCAKYVRLGFMASGLIPSHPGIAYARNYKPYFDRNGWTDLFKKSTSSKWSRDINKDLFKTPSGCAVVYDAIDAKNDRNGHIGHIETRVKHHSNKGRWGFISDYFTPNSRNGLKCIKKGKTVRRLKTFTARGSSPFYGGGKRIKKYINVTQCAQFSKAAAVQSNEWDNRKVISVNCKL